jgi:hypothetical protein
LHRAAEYESKSFIGIARSLDGVPETLEKTERQLTTTTESLRGVQDQIDGVAAGIGSINSSLDLADGVVGQYQDIITELRGSLDKLQNSIGVGLGYIRLGFSLALIRLGIAQIALITQGWELFQRSRARAPSVGPVLVDHVELVEAEG